MKHYFIILLTICCAFTATSQIEPVHFIEEEDYGALNVIIDYKVFEDHFIISGLMEDENNRQIPIVARIDAKGKVIWSTINQSSEPLGNYNSTGIKLELTGDGVVYAMIGNYITGSRRKYLWKIDIASGEIIDDNLFYSDYSGTFNLKDYNDEYLISISQEDGGNPSFDINEIALIDKNSGDTTKTERLGPFSHLAKLAFDDAQNFYVGEENRISKYNRTKTDELIWSITLENTEEISELHIDNDGDLFAFTRSPGDGGYLHSIDRNTGNLNWTVLTSLNVSRVSLSDFIEDEDHIYTTYRHLLVGSVDANFQASKIRKEDGEVIWSDIHTLNIPNVGGNTSGDKAAALEIALDCDFNLYMTGYHGDANYGPALCGVVKVDAQDGSTVWDQTLTIYPDEHDSNSVGVGASVIDDTLVILANLQYEEWESRAYTAGLDLETGEVYYLNRINIETCEYSVVNDLMILEEGFVDASLLGKNVISNNYNLFNVSENVAIDGYVNQQAGHVYSDNFGHSLTAYAISEEEQTTSIFINSKLSSPLLRMDTISAATINAKPIDLDGGWGYRAVTYGVDTDIRLSLIRYSTNSKADILLDTNTFDINNDPKRNCLLTLNNSDIIYLGKDRLDFYSTADLALIKSYPYSSTLHTYDYAKIDNSKLCMVGKTDNGTIALQLMDYENGNIVWYVDTGIKGIAHQVQYDEVNGLYVTGISENQLFVARFGIENGDMLWQFENDQLTANVIPMDAAIVPERNTMAVACRNDLSDSKSDGMLVILSLQGNIVHIERFKDELDARSSLNAIISLNNKYYVGGSHNTLENGKRGIIYSADYSAINDEAGITGEVFYDENQNGLRDQNELGLPNMRIEVDPFPGYVLTNASGKFFRLAAEGESYTITAIVDTTIFDLTTDSTSYDVDFSFTNPDIANNDFGYFAELKAEASVNLTSDPTRCNTQSRFYLKVVNEGYFLESGSVILDFDPNVEYLSSFLAPTEYLEDQNRLIWKYDSLLPFEELLIPIDFMMPDEQNTGLEMKFYSRIESDNMAIILDEYTYTPTVLCSYDPNDKLVMPSGVFDQNYTLFGDSILTYTVRFQNTGNAPAINVRIRDTIDQNFDMSTFKIVNASHSLRTGVDDHFVEFVFKNIFLVDSLTNEPESHGQVTYEIKLRNDIEDNTLVENTASIYFDFNPPIVTNTITNLMVDMLPTGTNETAGRLNFTLHPNPVRDVLFLQNPNGLLVDKIRIFDSAGIFRMETSSKDISIRLLNPGYYIMQVWSDGQMTALPFVKM